MNTEHSGSALFRELHWRSGLYCVMRASRSAVTPSPCCCDSSSTGGGGGYPLHRERISPKVRDHIQGSGSSGGLAAGLGMAHDPA